MTTNTNKLFLELVRAGLWTEAGTNLNPNDDVDWEEVYLLAEEQSVIGVVLAGIEHSNVKPPQELLLQWIGEVQMLEQQNKAMNEFVAQLNKRIWQSEIFGLLVKGQGVAQCYEKPLWRTSGDIDLLLSEENYQKAKDVLTPIADELSGENKVTKHQAFVIKGFAVELHGKMPFGMSRRVDRGIDEAMRDCFNGGNVNSWQNGNTMVFVPSPANHIIFVFTHFLHHFFIEGVGLRQICDWCRLLYTYREKLDLRLLESRIKRMGLMTEWKVFYHLATKYFGMPDLDSRFMVQDSRLDAKAEKVLKRILKSGNFGHNNDLSYRAKYTGMTYKLVATWRRFRDFASLIPVFPMDTPRFFFTYVFSKAI